MRYANALESYVLNPLSVDDVSEYKRNYRKEESLIALKKKFACRIASFVSIASLVSGLYFIGDDIRFSFESLMLIIFAPVLSFFIYMAYTEGLGEVFRESYSIRISGVEYFTSLESFKEIKIDSKRFESSQLSTTLMKSAAEKGRGLYDFEKSLIANLVNI